MEYYELIFSNGYIAIVTAQTYDEAVKAITSTTEAEILHVLDKLDI